MIWELPTPLLDTLTCKHEVCWSHQPVSKFTTERYFSLLAQRTTQGLLPAMAVVLFTVTSQPTVMAGAFLANSAVVP